jgi:radical SAM superfamily enzyme YgiQ (UPF0313 family)
MPTPKNPDPGRILLVQAGVTSALYPFRSHPLGLMMLAACVRRDIPETHIRIIDMKVERITPQGVAREARNGGFGLVGVGAFSLHADIQAETARAVRDAAPGAVLVAGGPHATCHPERVLRQAPFDAAISGEGEISFTVLVRKLREDMGCNGLAGLPGISVLRDGEFIAGEPPTAAEPDTLPRPAWDLINLRAYERSSSFSILGRRRYMSLFTSRGCPFHCIYCHRIFGKSFRPRSAQSVVEEIRELADRYGITDFDILDDAFNLDRARVHAICEALLKLPRPVTVAFPNGLRSDLLDDETLKLMRRAGTIYISFAVESASPRMQKLMRKNLDLEKAERAIRTAARLGIFCNGFFMLGFPGETRQEMERTVRFATRSPLHTAHFLKVTPFEGTELFGMMPECERARAAAMTGAMKYYDRSFNLSDVDNKQFMRIMSRAHRRFYVNPARLLRLVSAHPFKRNVASFAAFAARRILLGSSRGE